MFSATLIPVLFLVAFLAGAILGLWFERGRGGGARALLEKDNKTLHSNWTEALATLDQARTRSAAQQTAIARLEERGAAEKQAFEEMRRRLPETFKALAGEVLQEKSKEFAEQNHTTLGHILDPLSTRLKDFQDQIEAARLEQVRGSAGLKAQVEQLLQSNTRITEEAKNLAGALKGSSKTQGIWGELILERVLEGAGLRPGEEYEVQESYAAENGRRAQPDVVLHLPGERHLVIDSKVSLVHYVAYCNAESEALREASLSDHLNSVRTHVKGLAEKNYQTLYGLNSLDFVVMFLPVEPAFMLALSRDDKLWEHAWQRNILLVSPSTLLFVVRTVAALWRQEQQKQNVEEIARRGAELYKKLAGFVEDLQAVGKRLAGAQQSYEGALNKLSTGPGNLIWQAEQLRILGVKPAKQLPGEMVERALQEVGEGGEDPIPGEIQANG